MLLLTLTGDKFCFGDVLFEKVWAGASSRHKTYTGENGVWEDSWRHHP